MSFTVILLIALAVFVLIVLAATSKSTSKGENHPQYERIGPLFTAAERSFFGVLENIDTNSYTVLGKVRVADILKPAIKRDKSQWRSLFNKISSKHFDFVLCDKKTLAVLCVIELDDKSHNSKKAQERDAFLDEACKHAQLPIIHIKTAKAYQIKHVRHTIASALSSAVTTQSDNTTAPRQQKAPTPPANKKVEQSISATQYTNDTVNTLEPEAPRKPNFIGRLSTSKIARKVNLSTADFLGKMVELDYLCIEGEKHKLTSKGLAIGGQQVAQGARPAYFTWDIDTTIKLIEKHLTATHN